MRFKFLHVTPHVWFYKQKETLGKATSDDSSIEPAFVYKRSTSLKLVRSGPSAESVKDSPSDDKPKSNTYIQDGLSNGSLQKQGKQIQVCTVVDAGCTCRATMTSQHKQKKAAGADCTEARGDGVGHGWRQWRPNVSGASSSSSSTTSNNMVSRLICKSTHDVVKNFEGIDEAHEVKQFAVDVGKETAPMRTEKACFDLNQLEFRLRNAGLEERRRKKKNKNYEEEPLISNATSSSISTNTNSTINSANTSEMQELVLNAIPDINFDNMDSRSMDNMISLADLRASLAQKKLGSHGLINQASLHCGEDQSMDCISDKLVSNEKLSTDADHINPQLRHTSASAFHGRKKANAAMAPSLPILQEFVEEYVAFKEKVESVKQVDVGMSNYLSQGNPHNHGLYQPKACNDLPKMKLLQQEESASSALIRRASRSKSTSNRHAIRKEKAHELAGEHGSNGAAAEAQLEPNQGGDAPQLGTNQRGAQPDAEMIIGGKGRLGGGYDHDEDEQLEKQVVVSSSSCEIQVPSDYYDNHNAGGTIISMISGSSSSSAGEHHQGLVSSGGAVAMVKSSYDPHHDFKESMVEMVVAKRLRDPRQLQQLLQCYLSLNPEEYHTTIIKVFHELCSDLFH